MKELKKMIRERIKHLKDIIKSNKYHLKSGTCLELPETLEAYISCHGDEIVYLQGLLKKIK